MSSSVTVSPRPSSLTFLDWPLVTDLETLQAEVAVLGIPYGLPYRPDEAANDQSLAPDAIRAQSHQISDGPDHFDFDVGGPLLAAHDTRCVDAGNAAADIADPAAHYRNAEAAVRAILAAGALPLVLGGDHGVTIPALRAYEGRGPLVLVHIDAHLDWRDEVNGVREGYSSPIRRAAEMPWVQKIVQVGLRGTGSARRAEVDAALEYGADLVPAAEVHRAGMGAVLARIPDGAHYYLTVDADGLDPGIAPAVMAPSPGGLLFHQVRALIHGLVQKGRVVGMDVVEVAPSRDLNGITCITAGRLLTNLVGASVRAGHLQRSTREATA